MDSLNAQEIVCKIRPNSNINTKSEYPCPAGVEVESTHYKTFSVDAHIQEEFHRGGQEMLSNIKIVSLRPNLYIRLQNSKLIERHEEII